MSVSGSVTALSRSGRHQFCKGRETCLTLVAGLGVAGDCHAGETVQHLSRVRRDPSQPNLRQVHLIAVELYDDLRAAGLDVEPGQLGENVTTVGIDLLGLARGTQLLVGERVTVEVTGLRNPCRQLDRFRHGLLPAVLDRDADGNVVRKAGVMAIVTVGGVINEGDDIVVREPVPPLLPLLPV